MMVGDAATVAGGPALPVQEARKGEGNEAEQKDKENTTGQASDQSRGNTGETGTRTEAGTGTPGVYPEAPLPRDWGSAFAYLGGASARKKLSSRTGGRSRVACISSAGRVCNFSPGRESKSASLYATPGICETQTGL